MPCHLARDTLQRATQFAYVPNVSGGVCCRDIYTPISNVLFHHYGRQKGKSVFADHDNAQWWATVSCR